jgi:hypothetical protein
MSDFIKEGNSTRWSEEGIKKLAVRITSSEAIALRNKTEVVSQNETEISVHETQVKSQPIGNPMDRYQDLPKVLGTAIANKLIDNDILKKTDSEVIKKLTNELANRKPELEGSVSEIFALLDAIAS